VLKSLFHQFNTTLSDLFPSGSTYPLVRNCFVFEENEGTLNLDTGENLPGLTVVPHIANRKLHLGTLLGVLCSQVLIELGVMVGSSSYFSLCLILTLQQVQAMESPVGNEYLNAGLMPSLPPLSELPSPLNISRSESTTGLSSHSSQPEISRPSFTLNSAPILKRNVSTNANANRQSTLTVQAQKKRISTIGTSSSPGRMYKMLGDFFLLAGRTEDALIWYAFTCDFFYLPLELSAGTMKLGKSSETRMTPFGTPALVRVWRLRLLLKLGRLDKDWYVFGYLLIPVLVNRPGS
jgi:hypothetical protein